MKLIHSLKNWIKLIIFSLGISIILHFSGFPAAFLIGPMLAAIFFAARGLQLVVPRKFLLCAQSTVGVLIASLLDPNILTVIIKNAPAIGFVVATTILFSLFTGFLMTRFKLLPGNTAAWGCAPGAATGMVTLSEEYGADPRMVALMQFLRVTMVVFIATLNSKLFFGVNIEHIKTNEFELMGNTEVVGIIATFVIIILGALIAHIISLPSGGVFIPLTIAFLLQTSGLFSIVLPSWMLYCAFLLIGLWVGLKFERETVRYSIRVLPTMLVGVFSLIMLCGISAVILVWLVDIDPLTAYLATSPGALEAVTIIAVSSSADISFILALQTVRLLAVIALGPILARIISRVA